MTAKPTLPPGPLHRSYRGKMLYITDGVGEMGREYFSVTVQPDGQSSRVAEVARTNFTSDESDREEELCTNRCPIHGSVPCAIKTKV